MYIHKWIKLAQRYNSLTKPCLYRTIFMLLLTEEKFLGTQPSVKQGMHVNKLLLCFFFYNRYICIK